MTHIGLPSLLLSLKTGAFSYAGILILYLCSSPSKWEIGAVSATSLVVTFVHRAAMVNDFPFAPVVHVMAVRDS